jgi:hypothetical protein
MYNLGTLCMRINHTVFIMNCNLLHIHALMKDEERSAIFFLKFFEFKSLCIRRHIVAKIRVVMISIQLDLPFCGILSFKNAPILDPSLKCCMEIIVFNESIDIWHDKNILFSHDRSRARSNANSIALYVYD